jgi:hypothetical protein
MKTSLLALNIVATALALSTTSAVDAAIPMGTVTETDQLVNGVESTGYQPGDKLQALFQYSVVNSDPCNSYVCQVIATWYDADGNQVAGSTVTFTVGAATACGCPTTDSGVMNGKFTVPTVDYSQTYNCTCELNVTTGPNQAENLGSDYAIFTTD